MSYGTPGNRTSGLTSGEGEVRAQADHHCARQLGEQPRVRRSRSLGTQQTLRQEYSDHIHDRVQGDANATERDQLEHGRLGRGNELRK